MVNYKLYASPLFEVAKPCKLTAISVIIYNLYDILHDCSFNTLYSVMSCNKRCVNINFLK